jgi:2-polyprenyl-3-methyl-5-hydroxy-6-metoxy-1,4-benzoquinol methylase
MKKHSFNPSIFMSDSSEVRRYQSKYANIFLPQESVLDVGCGSGTFLELLRERQVNGIGIDTSPDVVRKGLLKGLHIEHSDALSYLKKKKNKYDGLMLSHIIEHLPPADLINLLTLANKRLNLNGRVIVITPNFKDIDVATSTFWLDITHIRPYPLPLLKQLFEYSGFSVSSMGFDPNTGGGKPPYYRIRSYWRYRIRKIRFGEYFGNGDAFLIAKKIV